MFIFFSLQMLWNWNTSYIAMSRLHRKAVQRKPNHDRGLQPGKSVTDGGNVEERGGEKRLVMWTGMAYVHTFTHTLIHSHAHTLVYINRYSVKTGTVTLGSYKVHLSVGTKYDQWQVFKKRYLLLSLHAGNRSCSQHVWCNSYKFTVKRVFLL